MFFSLEEAERQKIKSESASYDHKAIHIFVLFTLLHPMILTNAMLHNCTKMSSNYTHNLRKNWRKLFAAGQIPALLGGIPVVLSQNGRDLFHGGCFHGGPKNLGWRDSSQCRL